MSEAEHPNVRELEMLLNDPDIPMQAARVWDLLEQLSGGGECDGKATPVSRVGVEAKVESVPASAHNEAVIASLLRPARLWSAAEIVNRIAPVPRAAGIYAWYFDEIPPGVPTTGCHVAPHGQVLLYVGI